MTNPCIGYKSADSTCSYCNISFYSLKFTKNPSQTISLSDCQPKNSTYLTNVFTKIIFVSPSTTCNSNCDGSE